MREAYQEKAAVQLHEWGMWIDQYRRSIAQLSQVGSEKQTRLVERLDDSHREAGNLLNELRASPADRWDASKELVEQAMVDLKKILDESGAGLAAKPLSLEAGRGYLYEPFQRRG